MSQHFHYTCTETHDVEIVQDDLTVAGPSTVRREDTGLGSVDFDAVQHATSVLRSKRSKYNKYSDEDRYKIGRYGSENGPIAAVRKFKTKYPNLNESTVREMKKRYEELLKADMYGNAD